MYVTEYRSGKYSVWLSEAGGGKTFTRFALSSLTKPQLKALTDSMPVPIEGNTVLERKKVVRQYLDKAFKLPVPDTIFPLTGDQQAYLGW